MIDVHQLLERQAAWQKAQASLPWPEKIRMVEAVMESVLALRRSRPGAAGNDEPPVP